MALDHTNVGIVSLVLLPVRGATSDVHLVKRDARDPLRQPALCGTSGPLDARARPSFRRVRAVNRYCQACLAASCAGVVSRIDWT